jgi:hypothetical protein
VWLLLACAGPPESDRAYAGAGAWTVGGARLELHGTVLEGGGLALSGVYDEPVQAGGTLYVPADTGPGDGAIWAISTENGVLTSRIAVADGRPDRLAVSPDGSLAFVSGRSGLASVWLRTPAGELRQLTNVGVRPTPGHAPKEFVAPPRVAPVFSADDLRWDEGAVRWR